MSDSTQPQSKTKPRAGRCYLYAIAAAQLPKIVAVGLDGCPVHTIAGGALAAVVSDCARPAIRPERACLAAHKEVLKRCMVETTVLPVTFGTIADSPKAIRRMLTANQKLLLDQLRRVAGKVEMGLRVIWDVPNIFEFFVGIHPELRMARDRLMGGNREPGQEEKLELGKYFEDLLNRDRETHYQTIAAVLAPCCAELRLSSPRSINEVVNLNCLVARERQPQMEEAVFAAAKQFDDNFAFDINGPWAPHNFVEMDLTWKP